MKIVLKCLCGAEASWESDEFLPFPEDGMKFLVERIARQWQFLHSSCGYHVSNVDSMWQGPTIVSVTMPPIVRRESDKPLYGIDKTDWRPNNA